MAAMNEEEQNTEEEQNPLVEIEGVHVIRQDGNEAVRHNDCLAEDNEKKVLGSRRIEDPDAVAERFKCYVCGKAVDALSIRIDRPLLECGQ